MADNFIGAGERTAIRILLDFTDLTHRDIKKYPQPGLYTQMRLPTLLSDDYKQDLHSQHVKSSVDIVFVWRERRVAVYVNGKDHSGVTKSQRDSVRYRMLARSGFHVVVLPYYEFPMLFKEKIDEAERIEIIRRVLVGY